MQKGIEQLLDLLWDTLIGIASSCRNKVNTLPKYFPLCHRNLSGYYVWWSWAILNRQYPKLLIARWSHAVLICSEGVSSCNRFLTLSLVVIMSFLSSVWAELMRLQSWGIHTYWGILQILNSRIIIILILCCVSVPRVTSNIWESLYKNAEGDPCTRTSGSAE